MSVEGLCAGRVVVVTGAGRGIGRAEALEFGRERARVIVADIGVDLDGSGSSSVAEDVVREIAAAGGEAIACMEDVGDFAAAKRIVDLAVETWGSLDTIVNNAGILRDRMIFNMDESDFDAVMRVHLKGTFNLIHWGARYWRARSKEGMENDARIVNTSSPSGLYGNVGQANYGAAKAGIALLTMVAAAELGRYGVNANCISPRATTRMTEALSGDPGPKGEWDPRDPANIAPVVAWLGSAAAKGVNGRVFDLDGGNIAVAEMWRPGPAAEKEGLWEADELGDVIPGLVAQSETVGYGLTR